MLSSNQYNFQKLTPIDDIEDLTAYEEALKFALENQEIKNVAITGIYGSGKSSMLESFKNRENVDKNQYIHISLSNFEKTTEEKNEKKLDNKTLEGKILNQLLHQIDTKDIPQTIFKLKRNVTILQILKPTLLIVFMSLLLNYFWNFETWSNQYSSEFANFVLSGGFRIFLILVFIFLITFIIYKIVELQYNRQVIKKFSFRAANFQSDVNVFEDSKESYFDKYLDDVIYLFDNSDANVIVFEDIDRFDNNVIFAKLKEINTLVNNNKNEDEKITFIYMLKDDMFFSRDRTKFFDFIIPVVPIINSSNSYDKLKEILEKQSIANMSKFKNNHSNEEEKTTKQTLFDLFDNNFLLKISLYLDDMRLLMNVVNEFIIYFERINSLRLNINKFFAMIVYKNIFPNDFAKFQLNRGFVYHLFNTKDIFNYDEKNLIEKKIKDVTQEIVDSRKETVKSEYELYALYFNWSKVYYTIKVDNKYEKDFEDRAEFIKAIVQNDFKVTLLRSGYSMINEDLTEEFTKIKEKPEFIKRIKNIENKTNNEISQLQEEKKSLESKMKNLSELGLYEFITRKDIEIASREHFTGLRDEFEDIKKSPYFDLLVFLITNGYIDEDHSFYLTYFHPESLTVEDQEFLRGVLDNRKFNYNYQLTNLSEVYNRLEPKDFQKLEVLNFNLFEYLLEERNLGKKNIVLKNYFKLIYESNNIDFLIKFYLIEEEAENNEIIKELLNQLYINSPSLFKDMITEQSISEVDKNKFIIEAFTHYKEEELDHFVNDQNVIKGYIEKSIDLLYLKEEYSSQFMDNLAMWHVKFEKVDFEKTNSDLGAFIYKNHMYVINENNLYNILDYFYNFKDEENLKYKNYTLIYNGKNTPIKEHIQNHINDYLRIYLEFTNGIIQDDLEAVYSILNNEDVETGQKEEYIESLQEQKLNLSEIDHEDLYTHLVTENKLLANSENILLYYQYNEDEWTVELIDYVNANKSILNFDWPHNSEKFEDNYKRIFFRSTIKENRLNDTAYENILNELNYYYTEGFTLANLSDEKIIILIQLDIIRLTVENLVIMRSNHPNSLIRFISINLEKYLELTREEDIYEYDELLKVLEDLVNSNSIIDDQKQIVDAIKEPISIMDKPYKAYLINHILKTKPDLNDLSYFVRNYSSFRSTTRSILFDIISNNIDKIIDSAENIPKILLDSLLQNDTVEIEKRQKLFGQNINKYSDNELKDIFGLLEMNRYLTVINQNRRGIQFLVNKTNENILEKLKNRELISSYSTNGTHYTVNSKKELNLI